jgi:hypothetical protein
MTISRTRLFWCFAVGVLTPGTLLGIGSNAFGEDIRWESMGLRFGFYPNGAAEDFHQAEVCAKWTLPWGWDLDSVWRLQTKLDTSVGWIGDRGVNAAIATAGPTLCLARQRLPLSFELGVSPTVLTRSAFPSKDLGFPFQFTSYAGLNLDLGSHIRLTYRIQHMSNADIAKPNPGLNLHMLGVSYLF